MDRHTSKLMDRVRGIGALIVAVAHSLHMFILPYTGLNGVVHLGSSLAATYAVMAFFIVSGFMIYHSVARHSVDGVLVWRDYARARILRIYPPLLAALVLSLLIYFAIVGFGLHGAESYRIGTELFVVRDRAELDTSRLLASLFLTYGMVPYSPPPLSMNGPLWTLGYEFWIYFLVMFALNARAGRKWIGYAPLAILIGFILIGRNHLFLMLFGIWLCGYGLGWAYHNKILFRDARYLAFAIVAAGTAIVYLGYDNSGYALLHPYDGLYAQFVMFLTGLLFTLLLAVLVRLRLSERDDWAVSLAAYSYTLYVVHFPLLLLAFSLTHETLYQYDWPVSLMAGAFILVMILIISDRIARVVENRVLIRAVVRVIARRPLSQGR